MSKTKIVGRPVKSTAVKSLTLKTSGRSILDKVGGQLLYSEFPSQIISENLVQLGKVKRIFFHEEEEEKKTVLSSS